MTTPVHSRPPETRGVTPDLPERGYRMAKQGKRRPPIAKRTATAPTVTLAQVLAGLERSSDLSATRLRDLRSAVKRLAVLLGDEPSHISLDMGSISARLAAVN